MNIIKQNKRIPINIWDDFYDDGYCPEGDIVKTRAYIEDYELTDEIAEKAMEYLYNFIKDLSILNTVKFKLCGDIIFFENITHKILDDLMSILDDNDLTFDDYFLDIYSES